MTQVTPQALLQSRAKRLYLTASLQPVAGQHRFQPAGFPEVGHVIYRAPVRSRQGRRDGQPHHGEGKRICIVDSPASMANHLESVCVRASHDPDLVEELSGLPYVRCVTDQGWPTIEKPVPDGGPAEVVVTTLTEGHRLASSYFLDEKRLLGGKLAETSFAEELMSECNILDVKGRAHPSVSGWWKVFVTLFKYDPNCLVHGVMFPKWGIKLSRILTPNMEAIGVQRIDRSGVKFDRLQKTTSGQPIFAVDDEAAEEIRATFVLDLALVRSFGRDALGLTTTQKELLVSLALWKVGQLVQSAFRYRSNCDLECVHLEGRTDLEPTVSAIEPSALADLDMQAAIKNAGFSGEAVTDIYWPSSKLYDTGKEEDAGGGDNNG